MNKEISHGGARTSLSRSQRYLARLQLLSIPHSALIYVRSLSVGRSLHVLYGEHFWRDCVPSVRMGRRTSRHSAFNHGGNLLSRNRPHQRFIGHRYCREDTSGDRRSLFPNRQHFGLKIRRKFRVALLLWTGSRMCIERSRIWRVHGRVGKLTGQ